MGDLSAYCVWPGTSVLLPTFPIASHWIFHVYRKHSSFDSILIKLFYISWMIEMDKLQLLEGEILSFCDVRLKQQISSVPKKKNQIQAEILLAPHWPSWFELISISTSYMMQLSTICTPYVRLQHVKWLWQNAIFHLLALHFWV